MKRALGVAIAAVVLIVLQQFGSAKAESGSKAWLKVDTARWIRTTPALGGRATFTFERRADGDWFSVTMPCVPLEQRTYTSTWKRGDAVALIWLSCDNQLLVEREVGELEVFFLDLPDGAPPALPASYFFDPDRPRLIV